jgi:hypothetical protein
MTLAISLPYTLFATYFEIDNTHAVCVPSQGDGLGDLFTMRNVQTANFAVFYFAPVVLLVCLYARMGRTLWTSADQLVTDHDTRTQSPCTKSDNTHTHNSSSTASKSAVSLEVGGRTPALVNVHRQR